MHRLHYILHLQLILYNLIQLQRGMAQISFSGRTWQLRQAHNRQGPGPNYFSSSHDCVYVDQQGRLIMRINILNGNWTCSQVILTQSLGYGSYIFQVGRGHDDIQPRAVLGLFTYQVEPSNWDPCPHKQIDIEIARWSVAENQNSQYVVQNKQGSIATRFNPSIGTGKTVIHAFTWRQNQILFQSYLNNNLNELYHQIGQPSWHETQIKQWKYTENTIPFPQNQKVHINFWLHNGNHPMYNHDQTVENVEFRYKP